ncbi:MAG: PEP-CTERM sorting domain-containing protein [Caulobacterales bacterium]|nr:PEP-CTERM sorting domain-containing protein [Caulobacterales bacterium]
MNRLLTVAALAAGTLAFAAPANAAITFCEGAANTCGGQGDTVHLDGNDDGSDNIVNGTIVNGTVGVIITDFDPQNITSNPNGQGQGQAWVNAAGSTKQNPLTFDSLDFALTGGYRFTHIEFDLNPPNGGGPQDPWSVTIFGYDASNTQFSQIFNGNKQNNFFNANADGGDVFTHVSFNAPPLVGVGHIRIGGANLPTTTTVPEPATWALMIMGFGGAGAMLRRRRTIAA